MQINAAIIYSKKKKTNRKGNKIYPIIAQYECEFEGFCENCSYLIKPADAQADNG